MKVVEENLLTIATLSEAMRYYSVCDRFLHSTQTTVPRDRFHCMIIVHPEDRVVGASPYCLVLVHPAWSNESLLRDSWNRMRSLHLGCVLPNEYPLPKLILSYST